jgi:hypothetical protein
MSVSIESTLILQMSAAYNAHFLQNANAGEALVHMMEHCNSLHPKLRSVDPKAVLVLLSSGKSFSSRAQLRKFAVDVIVYLVGDVVGSKYSYTELIEATEQKVIA